MFELCTKSLKKIGEFFVTKKWLVVAVEMYVDQKTSVISVIINLIPGSAHTHCRAILLGTFLKFDT